MRKSKNEFIPNALRKCRKTRGLKQKEVASLLGVKNTGMISRWEQGVCLPNTLNIFKLANLYRTMADALYIDLNRKIKENLLAKEEEIFNTGENQNR